MRRREKNYRKKQSSLIVFKRKGVAIAAPFSFLGYSDVSFGVELA